MPPGGPPAATAAHTRQRSTSPGTVNDQRDTALGKTLKALICRQKNGTRQPGKTKKIPLIDLLHLFHRLLIIATAVWYFATSVESSVKSLRVLRGVRDETLQLAVHRTDYILPWMGTSTIRSSPFVMQVLENDTSPRPGTIYLEANRTVSTTGCATPRFEDRLYSNEFLRVALTGFMRDCAYNVTELSSYEVVVPIVDCSFPPLVSGDDTNVRAFFILRHKTDVDDVLLMVTRFNMQDYKVFDMKEYGPFGMGNHHLIKDMSHPKVFKTIVSGALGYPFEPAHHFVFSTPKLNERSWWVTTMVPPSPAIAPKLVTTSSRTGFFVGSDDEQANVMNQFWTIDDDPVTVLTQWHWKGEPQLKDSWAWVHLIHVFFAIDACSNLLLFFLIMFRNFQRGRFWIGDAFVSISSTLMLRGVMIFISWGIGSYWTLMEFCLHDAHKLADTREIFFHPDIVRADLLTLFLTAATIISYALKERIDPVVAIVVFEIAFNARLAIVKLSPTAVATITAFAQADLELSVLGVSETVALASPLRLWTSHVLQPKDVNVIMACLFPLFLALVVIVVYVFVRKIYHHFHRKQIYKQDSKNTTGTHVSQSDEATMTLYKRNLTLFEIATGAELTTRFGILSDYENYLFIKGMKYASADGIFSNGFVIANGKFLIATEDWLSIVLQKLIRVRVRSVYTYLIDGNTVQQRAGLVYPETLSWDDLTQLNVTVLS